MNLTVSRLLLVIFFVYLLGMHTQQVFAHTMPAAAIESALQNRADEETPASLNNLTVVTIQEEQEPFFTLIWKDSPKGKEATVDVYFYDEMGQRTLVAMDKWDNSGWLDHSLLLCRDCDVRAVSIPAVGQVEVPAEVTLFELVWHGHDSSGQEKAISTFGTIDPQLSWSIFNTVANPALDSRDATWGLNTLEQEQLAPVSFTPISIVSITFLILTLMLMTISAVGYGWWIGQGNT